MLYKKIDFFRNFILPLYVLLQIQIKLINGKEQKNCKSFERLIGNQIERKFSKS